MSYFFEEIFKSLLFLNGIIALILLSFKIFVKIWFSLFTIKKDNETFEKRWYDCD